MATRHTTHVGQLPSGLWLLVERWPDGTVTVATRSHESLTWGPPVELEARNG